MGLDILKGDMARYCDGINVGNGIHGDIQWQGYGCFGWEGDLLFYALLGELSFGNT